MRPTTILIEEEQEVVKENIRQGIIESEIERDIIETEKKKSTGVYDISVEFRKKQGEREKK